MPVQLGSKLPQEHEARIEIIPLIDIMFFLLASFMLVSLSMVNLKSLDVDLPTATAATEETPKDLVSLSVDKSGGLFFERTPVGPNELADRIAGLRAENAELRVFISGDREARHGDIIRALDIVRGAGVQNIAFEIGSDAGTASDFSN